jgi:hypothetical protein
MLLLLFVLTLPDDLHQLHPFKFSAFLQTRVSEPLLCLTVSATLRDKHLLAASHRKIVSAALIAKNLPFEHSDDSEVVDSDEEVEDIMHGMAEVNLLTGLNDGMTVEHQVALNADSTSLSI